MPPCENRTRPTSNCLSCRPPLRNCCAGMTQMKQKPAPFGVGFFYCPPETSPGTLYIPPPETLPDTPYIPPPELISSRSTYQVCTQKRPPIAFQMYIPPQKHCPTPCTYQVCTQKRPPSAFQMYILPRNAAQPPAHTRYVHKNGLLARSSCTYLPQSQ